MLNKGGLISSLASPPHQLLPLNKKEKIRETLSQERTFSLTSEPMITITQTCNLKSRWRREENDCK